MGMSELVAILEILVAYVCDFLTSCHGGSCLVYNVTFLSHNHLLCLTSHTYEPRHVISNNVAD